MIDFSFSNFSCAFFSKKSRSNIYISLGSNLGKSLDNLQKGASLLQKKVGKRLRLSRPWRTSPKDCPADSPQFINAVAQIQSPIAFSPRALLACLQDIERKMGRQSETQKRQINAPRTLDLDLIAYENLCLTTRDLTLPHPRAHRRFFVLAPLNELDPEFRFPDSSLTIAQCLLDCDPDPNAKPIEKYDWMFEKI